MRRWLICVVAVILVAFLIVGALGVFHRETQRLAAPAGWTPVRPSASTEPGAASLGSVGCPQNPDTVYVDASHGSDDQPGSIERPVRSIQEGIRRAARGGVVALRGGVYHEQVFVDRSITLCGYPGEEVWLDGSEAPPQWERTETGWQIPWTLKFDANPSFVPGVRPPDGFVNPEYPLAANPEMVFRDGQRLRQVAVGAKALGVDEFAVDNTGGTLTVGADPGQHDIRVSTLQRAIVVGAQDVTIEGLGVRRYANSVGMFGAVYLGRSGNLLRHVVVQDVATVGVTVANDVDHQGGSLDRVTVERAGLMGVHVNWADGVHISNCRIVDSNYERFNATPAAGGVKVTRSRHIVIEGNEVVQSHGAAGIWLDEAVVDFTVRHNVVRDGGGAGVVVELSSGGLVATNEVSGQLRGLVVYNSGHVVLTANKVRDSGEADVWLAEDRRRQDDPGAVGRDPRFGPGDPTNTWRLQAISMVNNQLGSADASPACHIFVLDSNSSVDPKNLDIRGNRFSASPKSNVSLVAIDAGQRDEARRAWLTDALTSSILDDAHQNALDNAADDPPAPVDLGADLRRALDW